MGQSATTANFSPDTGEFSRYDLPNGTAPAGLVVDGHGTICFASNKRRQISSLNPSTPRAYEIAMPDKKTRFPTSLALDRSCEIRFSVEDGNILGLLTPGTGVIDLIPVPTKKVSPRGIVLDSKGRADIH